MNMPEVFDRLVHQEEGSLDLEAILQDIKVELQGANVEVLLPTFCKAARFLAEKNEGVFSIIIALLGLQRVPLVDNSSVDNQLLEQQAISLNTRKSVHEELVEKSIKFMKTNLMAEKPISLSVLCDEVGTNPTTLIDCFRQEIKMSPMKFFQQMRLERAAQLLSEGNLSISMVSESCLYENQGNFSTSFRKRYGLSPSEYRKRTA